ncbi:lipocalin family protein [uncultured Maribacter sp.]|uniref:lipocalin family protein n=1 Tax=uncultured Maribacter sp. TaxID=431308 RepID=UPI00262E1D28|nr:lipocalin family protein [uncultured Maribacter sp.]
MKHILILLFSISLISCGTSKTVRLSHKVIKGNWNLNQVTYSEPGIYNVTLLNDADKDCFEGSSWQFIPNNNTGVYTISKSNCAVGNRNFIFTIKEIDEATGLYNFLLKPTDSKNKSQNNVGFRLNLAQLTESDMVWTQTLTVDGKPFTISMIFSKK